MGLLNRELLLQKEAFKIEKVEIKDANDVLTGDYVFVRQMSAKASEAFQQSSIIFKKDKNGVVTSYEQDTTNYFPKLVIATVCDEAGTLLLQPKDMEILSQNMTALTISQIAKVASKLNGLDEKKKEENEKNSKADLDGNSTSDSVEN